MFTIWPRQSAAAAGAGLLLLVISVWGIHVLYWQGSSTGLAIRQTASEEPLPARLPPTYQVHWQCVTHMKVCTASRPRAQAMQLFPLGR